MQEFISKSLFDTKKIACKFAESLLGNPVSKLATVVGLYGELGSGKTTFMKYFAEALGVEETIQSPTFVIERIYDLGLSTSDFRHLIHIDAYRLESGEELNKLVAMVLSTGQKAIQELSEELNRMQTP